MNRIIGLLVSIVFASIYGYAQLCYPVVGTYKGKSAQGIAIWGNNAYLFNDGGHCRIYNINSEKIIGEFDLASSGKNTHVNAACFGRDYVNGNQMPVIYISEYRKPSRCFVENITDTASTMVQTIRVQKHGKDVFIQSWIVDNEMCKLYTVSRMSPLKGEKNTKQVRISKYRLPLLDEGEDIILTEKDCQDTFLVEFANAIQGGKIKGGCLYIVSGLQETSRGKFNAERAIQVIDLKKRKILKSIDLTHITVNEPEDMDFYNNKAILYCGQNGGLYIINL